MKQKPKKVTTCFDLVLPHTITLANGIVLTGDLMIIHGLVELYCKEVSAPLEITHPPFAPGMSYTVDPACQALFDILVRQRIGYTFTRQEHLIFNDGLTIGQAKDGGLTSYRHDPDGGIHGIVDATLDHPNSVLYAHHLYLSRKGRHSDPDGHFDTGGRWYPSDTEKKPCCNAIRDPSKRYPYSLLVHARTAGHIAQLCHVTEAETRTGRAIPPAKEDTSQIPAWISETDEIRYL